MHISQVSIHLLIFLITLACTNSTDIVNPYLKKFSRVNFNRNDLINNHERSKRQVDEYLSLKFESHGKIFDMKIKPVKSDVLKNDYILVDSKKISTSDFHIYEGYLLDEPKDSLVRGTIIDGIFSGTITSKKDGIYHVEPANKYEKNSDSHSVVFHESDIDTKPRKKRSAIIDDHENLNGDIGCGSTNRNVREALAEEQKKITKTNERKPETIKPNTIFEESETYKYSKEANLRNKRQSDVFPNASSVCSLYLKIDPFLYDTIFSSEGNRNDVLTKNYLLYYLNEQVNSLNRIFKTIQSSQSLYFQTLTFKIYAIKIYRFEDCKDPNSNLTAQEKLLCENYLDPINFLNYVSSDNFNEYCLSYTFTSRDFADGTLGLAWLASANGAIGGICEKQAIIQETAKSLNSGIVTLVNFGSRVPEKVNQITFAHEMGHSLGSDHDPSECSPGGSSGNYIMYSRATTGSQPNNALFSSCSINQMNSVMKVLLSTAKNCFRPNEPICGNGIIEEGELCDTGNPVGGNCCIRCKERVRDCDPSEGPCCDPNSCTFYKDGRICLLSNDCRDDIRCNNVSAGCPIQSETFFKPDFSPCNDDTQVCRNGTCSDSICERYNLTQCYLEGNLNDTTVDKSVLCYLSCIGGLTNNQCKLTRDIQIFGGKSYSLRPGSACSGYKGYCDVFSKCRSVNAQGTLSKLAKTLLKPTQITFEDLKTWAIKYWWAVLIFCFIFICLNGLILFCVTRHIKSDNPEKNLELRFRDTLKNPCRMFQRRPLILKNDTSAKAKRLRENNVKSAAKEVQPKIEEYNDDEYKLQPLASKKLQRIIKNQRQQDD